MLSYHYHSILQYGYVDSNAQNAQVYSSCKKIGGHARPSRNGKKPEFPMRDFNNIICYGQFRPTYQLLSICRLLKTTHLWPRSTKIFWRSKRLESASAKSRLLWTKIWPMDASFCTLRQRPTKFWAKVSNVHTCQWLFVCRLLRTIHLWPRNTKIFWR